MTPAMPIPMRIARFFTNYWSQLLRDLCAAVVTVLAVWAGLSQNNTKIEDWIRSRDAVVLGVLVVLGVIGGVKSWLNESGVQTLKEEIRGLEGSLLDCRTNYSELLRAELAILASTLGFSHTERISVYKHDGQAFVMLGRFSSNPDFNRRGRGVYPDNQGCIQAVWHQGRAFGVNFPNASTHLDEYVEHMQRRWQMDPAVVRRLQMKGRSIGGIRIVDSATGVPIAVMIFESMRAHGINGAILNEAERVDDGRVGRFLERMRAVEPTPTFARSQGY